MLQKPTHSTPPPCHLSLSNLKLSPRGACKYLAQPLSPVMSARMQLALRYFVLALILYVASETIGIMVLFQMYLLLAFYFLITHMLLTVYYVQD